MPRYCDIGVSVPNYEGHRYVQIRILRPSGITEDQSVFQVLHSGWTLHLCFYYPDWFLNPDIVLQADNFIRISDAEVTVFDDGVLMLFETDQQHPFHGWIVALPIQVEQQVCPNDVEFIARAIEGHDRQFTSCCADTISDVVRPLHHHVFRSFQLLFQIQLQALEFPTCRVREEFQKCCLIFHTRQELIYQSQ